MNIIRDLSERLALTTEYAAALADVLKRLQDPTCRTIPKTVMERLERTQEWSENRRMGSAKRTVEKEIAARQSEVTEEKPT